jgi:hypothetical protein
MVYLILIPVSHIIYHISHITYHISHITYTHTHIHTYKHTHISHTHMHTYIHIIIQVDAPVSDSIFVNETGCLRFARDYGLIPYVMSVRQIKVFRLATEFILFHRILTYFTEFQYRISPPYFPKDTYRALNRLKIVVSGRLPSREMVKPSSNAHVEKSKRKVCVIVLLCYCVICQYVIVIDTR